MPIPSDWWKDFFSGVALDLWRSAVTEEQTRADAEFIEKLLRASPGAGILDVPCGNGRLALELAMRGYRLTGVDIAAGFIHEARSKAAERQLNVALENRDMRALPWQGAFDGALCFGNSFGYFDDAGNEGFLKAVSNSLKSGARFVVEATVAETILPGFQERRWYHFGSILFLINNRYDHCSGRVDTEYTFVRDGKEERRLGSQRIYTYSQLGALLEQAGFGKTEGFGSTTQEPFRLGSPRLFLVTTKQG